MLIVVDGDAKRQMIPIPAATETQHIGHAVVGNVITPALEIRAQQDPVFGFFDAHHRNLHRTVNEKLGLPVGERDMNRVVFYVVEKVAGTDIGLNPDIPVLKFWITGKFRRLVFAEVSEDKPQIFFDRKTSNTNFGREGFVFSRLLDTLTRAVVFPAVKPAPNAFPFDPAYRQRHPTMSTAVVNQVRISRFAAVQREFLVHDLYRLCPSRLQILGSKYRVPKQAHVSPRQRARAGKIAITKVIHVNDGIDGSHYNLSVFVHRTAVAFL